MCEPTVRVCRVSLACKLRVGLFAVMDAVRSIGGDLVEQVALLDEFEHPKKLRTSQTLRVTYRSYERVLTKNQANRIHQAIADELVSALNCEIR